MQRNVTTYAALAVLLWVSAAHAQSPPATDIFLAPLETSASGVKLGAPVNVTARDGYDNQPSFLPDGRRLLYTSIGDDGQADIWIYDLEEKTRTRLTKTAESEYSPTPIPGEDAVSVVRVEADSRQRLWRFPLAGGEPTLLLPDVEPVGYHAWADGETLALFVLGEPPTLQRARRGAGAGKILARDIGRALHRVPGGSAVSFVHKRDEGWTIDEVDLDSGSARTLLATRPGKEDFAWSPAGDLWMGDASSLYVRVAAGTGWEAVADLADEGISDITRIAVHPEGRLLAFVASGRW